jgi:hypothetical protein
VEVVRGAGAAHGMHERRDRRAEYVDQLGRFLSAHGWHLSEGRGVSRRPLLEAARLAVEHLLHGRLDL